MQAPQLVERHHVVQVGIRDDHVPEVDGLKVLGPLDQGLPVVGAGVQVPKFAVLQMLESE